MTNIKTATTDASLLTTGTLDGDRLPTMSENKKGGVPATGTPSGKYLKDDGTWGTPGGGSGGPATVKLTSDMDSTTVTTLADITGLNFSVTAGVYYRFRFMIMYRAAATTTGLKVSVTIPAATQFSAVADCPVSTAADGTANIFRGKITTSDDAVTGTGTPSTTENHLVEIEGLLLPSANGTLQARYASEVSGSAVTIKQGSCGLLWTL